jgi:type II secretory pathway component PulF
MGAVTKVSKLRQKAVRAKAETPEEVRKKLLANVLARVNRAGSILGEAMDHLQAGEAGAAEIGALAEVNAAVSEGISLVAFIMQVDNKEGGSEAGLILPPEPQLIVPG